MIAVGWLIHHRAETSTVERGCVATGLHALHHKDVFLKNLLPLSSVYRTVFWICGLRRVVKMYMFHSFVMGFRFKYNREGMISLNTKQDIWVKGYIFCALIPLF